MEDKHCPGLDPKLSSIIVEKCLHALGLPIEYSAIGGGECGKAFLSNGRVYKITTDKSEAIESAKLIGKKNYHIADIYNAKEIRTTLTKTPVFLIVLEKLRTDRDSIFYEMQEELISIFEQEIGEHLFDVLYHYRFNPTLYNNVYKEDVDYVLNTHQREKFYYNSLLAICDELKKNNIESLDLQYHNLGLKPNGNLAFFDLGFGEQSSGRLDAVDIGENVTEGKVKRGDKIDIYRDASVIVVRPLTFQASCKYGAYTNWCTAAPSNNYIWTDPENNILIYIIQKNYNLDNSKKQLIRRFLELKDNIDNGDNPTEEEREEYNDLLINNDVFDLSKIALSFKRGESQNMALFDSNNVEITDFYNRYTDLPINHNAINAIHEYIRSLSGNLNERVMSYMKDSSAMKVKKKCQLNGNGDGTSTACNQGDISNIELTKISEGVFYRVDSGFSLPRNTTAYDVVMHEMEENGNVDEMQGALQIAQENGIDLKKVSSRDIIWVTKTPQDAIRYEPNGDLNNVEEISIDRPLILADDGDNGYLVLNLKQSLQEHTSRWKSKYLRKFKDIVEQELAVLDTTPENSTFDLKTFDSLRSFSARKQYADSKLQKIGAGSSRIVYLMPDGKTVLKLASNAKGIAQNNSECGLGQDRYFSDIVANVINCHTDDLWIISEYAKKVSPNRFKELTGGADIKNLSSYLGNFQSENKGRRYFFSIDPIVKNQLDENEFVQHLKDLINSYNLESGDLGRLSSYGEVNRNGRADIVVSDYGLTTDVYMAHYDRSGKRNMYENYFDMNEEVKIGINDLPFKSDVEQAGGKIYSVGGAVRDNILGRESKDLDLLITGIPLDQLEQILHKYGKVDNVGKSFGIIKFNTPQTGELDIAIPRTEKKNADGGYQGFDVTSDHTLPIEKDLERRDFTINAIAKDASGLMIDPYGGQGDIEKKQIKMVNPQAFSDDPLRMLRAVQFAARFDFNIEPQTMHEIQKNASKIREISPERILIEFDKIVKKGKPIVGAKLLRQTGLYDQIFGVSRGINLADFNTVRTMGEFIYQLIKGANQNPAEFFKNNLKGDLDTYNEIKALQLGGQFKGDKKTIFDMYKTYPKSLDSAIFGQNFTNTVNYMKDHNIPFSLKEVPVSGNDLIELGYQGKEIGNMFVEILSKIYKEELPNEREAILGYVKSKKNVNESLHSITSDDYRSIDDSTLEKQINIVIGFKTKNDDGKAIYIPHEDLFEVYGYAYIALKYNDSRVGAILGKYESTLQAKFFENLQLIGKKLKEIGLLKQ